MQSSSSLLGGLTTARFLRDHWQKRPLLVRAALPGFTSPLTPEELAGLACEEGVESRLILERGGVRPWELRHGPFAERDFRRLPPRHWSLLVHEVDRHVPAVADLLEPFRFIPNWRIDDVMVSYAPAGGSVGAHIDQYDVFLLQGAGRRRWSIGRAPEPDATLREGLDVRLLKSFRPHRTFVLEPSDMLYLPPQWAHHGVAVDPCMTFSIGFRAPSVARLLASRIGESLDALDPDWLYADPDLAPQGSPGEITEAARIRLRGLMQAALGSDATLDRWLGRHLTEPTRESDPPATRRVSVDRLRRHVAQGGGLRRVSIARLAYARLSPCETVLFASGVEHDLPKHLAASAPLLCGTRPLRAAALTPHLARPGFAELLATLVGQGVFELDPPPTRRRA